MTPDQIALVQKSFRKVLPMRAADREVRQTAKRAKDRERHAHHEQNAVVVAGRDGLALRIVLREAFFAVGAGGRHAGNQKHDNNRQCNEHPARDDRNGLVMDDFHRSPIEHSSAFNSKSIRRGGQR